MKNQKSKIKNQKYKLKCITFCFLLVFLTFNIALLTFNLSKASAAGFALKVSPPIIQIEAIPPATFRAPFAIENPSDDPVSLRFIFRPFRATPTEDGSLEYLAENDPFPGADKDIFEKLALVDEDIAIQSLELGPKQKKKP